MIRLTNRNYLVSKIMISINMASKYINEKLSLRKRNGGHMWVNILLIHDLVYVRPYYLPFTARKKTVYLLLDFLINFRPFFIFRGPDMYI